MIVRFGDCINFLSSILQVNLYCYSKKMWAISTVLLQNFVKVCFIVKNFMTPLNYCIKLSLLAYKFTNCLNIWGGGAGMDYMLLYIGSISLYFTPHSTNALLHSTWLYITLLWLYFTVLNFTLLYTLALLYTLLYSTSFHKFLPHST